MFIAIQNHALLHWEVIQAWKYIDKEVGSRTAKLALLLIKSIKYEIVQFLLHEYLVKFQTVYIYQTFIVNNEFA